MISPFTKPGTKVVFYKDPTIHIDDFGQSRANIGDVLTVDEIFQESRSSSGFGANSVEFPFHIIGLHLLRYAELPRSITQYLDDVKSPITEREHV